MEQEKVMNEGIEINGEANGLDAELKTEKKRRGRRKKEEPTPVDLGEMSEMCATEPMSIDYVKVSDSEIRVQPASIRLPEVGKTLKAYSVGNVCFDTAVRGDVGKSFIIMAPRSRMMVDTTIMGDPGRRVRLHSSDIALEKGVMVASTTATFNKDGYLQIILFNASDLRVEVHRQEIVALVEE